MRRVGALINLPRLTLALMATALVAAGVLAARSRLFPAHAGTALDAYRLGDWRAAERLAAARVKDSPDDRDAIRVQARAAARLGHDPAARSLYARLGGASAMEAEDFWLFGTVLDRMGQREAARDCWIAGLRADPNHPELLQTIARDDLDSGKPIGAARFASRLAERPGWRDRGEVLAGRALAADDDPAGALASWGKLLERDPSMAGELESLRKPMARAWLKIGRPDKARELLRSGDGREPDAETAWLLGRTFLQERLPAAILNHAEAGRGHRDLHPLEPEPAPYVGSEKCRECHRSRAREVDQSRHSRTFARGLELAARNLPQPAADPGDPSVRHSLTRQGGELRYGTRQGDRAVDAVVAFAFGSGDRGMTLVGTDDRGRARELRLSLYDGSRVWDVTSGQMTPPQPGADMLGRILGDDELRSCFFCHTTVARSARHRIGPEAADHGIGCERCHGPGGNHLAAVAMNAPDPAIARPGPESGPDIVALCAGCHSPLGLTVSRTDPLAPRFPAAGLTWSRCYTESNGALDCLTCHDPHRDAETSPAYYERKCLGCHAPAAPPREAAASLSRVSHRRATCPVNPTSGCVDCHMPTASGLVPHTPFTDHFIRVLRPSGS